MSTPTPEDIPGDQPQRWYSADHYKSDRFTHVYCGNCFDQIPSWLVRYSHEIKPPYIFGGELAECEGCGTVASSGAVGTQLGGTS